MYYFSVSLLRFIILLRLTRFSPHLSPLFTIGDTFGTDTLAPISCLESYSAVHSHSPVSCPTRSYWNKGRFPFVIKLIYCSRFCCRQFFVVAAMLIFLLFPPPPLQLLPPPLPPPNGFFSLSNYKYLWCLNPIGSLLPSKTKFTPHLVGRNQIARNFHRKGKWPFISPPVEHTPYFASPDSVLLTLTSWSGARSRSLWVGGKALPKL